MPFKPSTLISFLEKALEIPTVTEVKGDDGHVSVRPAANDAYKVCSPPEFWNTY
jgi:hypothetical protein